LNSQFATGWGAEPMQLLVFVIASVMIIGGGIGVVVYRHPVHSALSLVLTLFGVAVQFVAMEAHFLAAVQVIVYAGAIVVLFLFVIMLLGVDQAEQLRTDNLPIARPLAVVMGLGVVGLLIAAIVSTRDTKPLTTGPGVDIAGKTTAAGVVGDHDANIRQLAHNLFSDNVFAFELTSVLLIVAVAGTVVMTRRDKRRAADDDEVEASETPERTRS
jgi:NADH-quinone oxidoreductase subunit J